MRVDRINYQKTFNLGNYTSERIGLEAELEAGDDWEVELKKLKKAVEDLHKATNPQLSGIGLTDADINWAKPEPFIPQPPPVIDRKAIERLEILIDDAKQLYDLQILQGQVAKYGLQESYDKKLKELQGTD